MNGIYLSPSGGLLIAERFLLRILETGPPALFAGVITDNEQLFPAGYNQGRAVRRDKLAWYRG